MVATSNPSVFYLLLLLSFTVRSVSPLSYVSHKNCNGKSRGTIVPNPGNCSQYIMCNGLRSTLGECPAGSHYNAEMLSCDKGKLQCPNEIIKLEVKPLKEPAQETEPIGQSTSTSTVAFVSTTMSETLPTTTALPLYMDGRPLCSLFQDLQFPHPQNCAYYYQCIRGFLTIRRCYFGYLWNAQWQRCVVSSEAQCQPNNETSNQLRKPILY